METKESKNIFMLIAQGVPKPVVYTLISGLVLGAFSLSYAFVAVTGKTNTELPQQITKVNLLIEKVDALTLDGVLMKTNAKNVNKSMDDVKVELSSQRDILLQILYRANQTYNNTK